MANPKNNTPENSKNTEEGAVTLESLDAKCKEQDVEIKRLTGLVNKLAQKAGIGVNAPKVEKAKSLTDAERQFTAKVDGKNIKFQLSNVQTFYSSVVKKEVAAAEAMKNPEILQALVDMKSGLVCAIP